MKINFIVRLKNPLWVARIIVAILAPILAYMGISYQDLTTWATLGDVLFRAVSNPFVVGLVLVSIWNTLQDPTTKGFGDSEQALTYTKPK